jgi:hypothetical protein
MTRRRSENLTYDCGTAYRRIQADRRAEDVRRKVQRAQDTGSTDWTDFLEVDDDGD